MFEVVKASLADSGRLATKEYGVSRRKVLAGSAQPVSVVP